MTTQEITNVMKAQEITDALSTIVDCRERLQNKNRLLLALLNDHFEHDPILNSVLAEWERICAMTEAVMDEATAYIKEEVTSSGESIVGDGITAQYVKGRTSWDGKGLAGYAVAFPEINQFKKVGNPFCSIKFSDSDKE